jgi:DeoR/GlpR family transcriptional regulator of sugar metabolism
MNKLTRQQKILELLTLKKRIDIAELCTTFDIVPMTARRDLKELEAEGKLLRTHGGAALPPEKEDVTMPFFKRTKIHEDQKNRIAQKALPYLKQHQHLFLASGTTVHALALQLKIAAPLTIVTDAVNIAYELSRYPNIQLLCLGGELRPNSMTLTGKMAEDNLTHFHLDAAFIGINAIDDDGRIYVSSIVESTLLQILFATVPKIYILADGSKLRKKDFVYVGTLNQQHTLITTDEIPAVCITRYEALGASVVVAK